MTGVQTCALPISHTSGAESADALWRLRHLLEQDDPAATEFFQHNAGLLKAVMGDVFKVVEMHTLNFDFEQALEAMAAMPGPENSAVHAS